jgi:hypothetical protein
MNNNIPTEEEIRKVLLEIQEMNHFQMAYLWRYAPAGSIYFRNDLPTANAFKERLFTHFGGITPEISKELM